MCHCSYSNKPRSLFYKHWLINGHRGPKSAGEEHKTITKREKGWEGKHKAILSTFRWKTLRSDLEKGPKKQKEIKKIWIQISFIHT